MPAQNKTPHPIAMLILVVIIAVTSLAVYVQTNRSVSNVKQMTQNGYNP